MGGVKIKKLALYFLLSKFDKNNLNMKTHLSLTITDRLLDKIEEVANKMHIDKDVLIVKAVKKYLFISEVKEIRKKLKPIIQKQGFKSEEDIFNSVS